MLSTIQSNFSGYCREILTFDDSSNQFRPTTNRKGFAEKEGISSSYACVVYNQRIAVNHKGITLPIYLKSSFPKKAGETRCV